VRTVAHRLADRGVRAELLHAEYGERRTAELTLRPAAPRGGWHAGGAVTLRWDDRRGWSWRPGDSERGSAAVHLGIRPAPAPDAVADWLLVAVAHPEATISRPGGPFDPADADPELRRHRDP
jgi:hypothetical protein